jgi:hypothetical protein
MDRTKTKVKRTLTIAQVRAEISKQIKTLHVHESDLQRQLKEVQGMIKEVSVISTSSKPKAKVKATTSKPKAKVKATTSKPKAKVKTKVKVKSKVKTKAKKISLADAVQKSMRKGKKCSISEIKEGIAKTGYSSTAKSFSLMINQTLGMLLKKGVLIRAGRGIYVRKGEQSKAPATKTTTKETIKVEPVTQVFTVPAGSVEEWKD